MKIFKSTTALLMLVSSIFGTVEAKQVHKFSEEQIEVMRNAWFAGADRGYGWTLAAIAWKESSAGKHIVNWHGPAFGPFHNLLKTVAVRENASTDREKIALMNKLVTDFDFAAEHAMTELDYWKERHNGNWNKAVQSYFGGNTPNTPNAIAYREDIVKKIRYLRQHKVIFND